MILRWAAPLLSGLLALAALSADAEPDASSMTGDGALTPEEHEFGGPQGGFDENITGNDCFDHPGACSEEQMDQGEPPDEIHLERWELRATRSGTAQQYDLVARAYMKAGKLDKAQDDFDRALAKKPDDVQALTGRSAVKMSRGDEAGAKADARAALALDPNNRIASIILGHGSISPLTGKLKPHQTSAAPPPSSPPPAQNAATDGVPLAAMNFQPPRLPAGFTPTPAQRLADQAEQKLSRRDPMGALVVVKQALDQDPKNPDILTLLARIDNSLRNPSEAVKAAAQALAIKPDNAQALRAKAYAEIQLGDYQQALEDALAAARLAPDNGMGYLLAAMAEEKLGKSDDALKHFALAAQLDPSYAPLASEARSRLQPSAPATAAKPLPPPGFPLWRKVVLGVSGLMMAFGIFFGARSAFERTTATTGRRPVSIDGPTVLESGKALAPGTLLGGSFRIGPELGRGGMGVVYDALDENLRRRVAIKQLQRDGGATSEDFQRFLGEARLVAQLKHPNIVEIYTVLNEGDLYLVFERVEGQTLGNLLELNRKLPLPAARKLVVEIAAALDCAHSRNIIHRDLKPSNVMMTKEGSAKVMDFGIAHQARSSSQTETSASGTPPYMAPEQALGSVSKASDLYALGVMTYEMLTGARPFAGPDFLEQKLRKTYAPVADRAPSLPKGLDAFMAQCLDPDPTKRPADAKTFAKAFDAACSA